MIIKKSVKYPIIYNMGYLAIQSFLLYNLLLFAVHGLGKSPEWGNAIYSVVWSLNAIMAIFIIKFSDKWGYKESLIIANICQIIAFILLSMATVPTFIVGSSIFGAGACLAVSQNYVVLSSTMTNDYKGRYNIFLFSYACMNASAFAAGIISGFSDVIGFSNVFLISGGLSVLMLIFTSLFYTRTRAVEGNVCFDLDSRSRAEKAKGFYRLLVVAAGCSVILMICMLFAEWVNLLVLVALLGVFVFFSNTDFYTSWRRKKKDSDIYYNNDSFIDFLVRIQYLFRNWICKCFRHCNQAAWICCSGCFIY